MTDMPIVTRLRKARIMSPIKSDHDAVREAADAIEALADIAARVDHVASEMAKRYNCPLILRALAADARAALRKVRP